MEDEVKTGTGGGADALLRVLEVAKAEAITATVSDRVYDTGHLTAEEMAAYAAGNLDATSKQNLRRHVIFCAVCSAEFLSLVDDTPDAEPPATGAEDAPPPTAAKTRRDRRALLLLLLVVGLAAGAALVFHLRRDGEVDTPEILTIEAFELVCPTRAAGPLTPSDRLTLERRVGRSVNVTVYGWFVAETGEVSDLSRLESLGKPTTVSRPLQIDLSRAGLPPSSCGSVILVVAPRPEPERFDQALLTTLKQQARRGGAAAAEAHLKALIKERWIEGDVFRR
jgi:hypothetical protein